MRRLENEIRSVAVRIDKRFVRIRKIKYSYGLNRGENRETEIVLSLASFPPRFSTLHICLNSLLHQTMKPDRIVVWIDDCVDEDQFTAEMLRLISCGIEFIHVPAGLKAHKKYLWAMQQFPDSIVITVDDDLIYPVTLVSSLIKSYKKHPKCVSARRVHKILWDETYTIIPYRQWMQEHTQIAEPCFDLLAVGGGGVLYPPHILPEEAFDIDKIRELCLDADDIWL